MDASVQQWIVAVIVVVSALYAAWSLMPRAWRNALLKLAGRAPASSAGCGGCDNCGPPAPASPKVITVHRRNAPGR
jgi:hypothetical protein